MFVRYDAGVADMSAGAERRLLEVAFRERPKRTWALV